MHLRQGEIVLKIVKRHPTPYFLKIVKIAIVSLPFYLIIYFIGRETDAAFGIGLFAAISFFIGIVIALASLDYLLDKLVITDKRTIWIDWRSPFKKIEHEAELLDIQDIETKEKGLLARLRIFDYGFLEIETASSKTCITFLDCPHPNSIKHFILSQAEKQRGGIHEKWEPPQEEEWSVN